MQEIVEVDSRLDIQKRYGSNCLVWKVPHSEQENYVNSEALSWKADTRVGFRRESLGR